MDWNKITEGIYNSIVVKEEVASIADKRRAICNKCPNNTKGLIPQCSICNCILKWKTHSMSAACPIGKWEAEILSDDLSNQIDKITNNE